MDPNLDTPDYMGTPLNVPHPCISIEVVLHNIEVARFKIMFPQCALVHVQCWAHHSLNHYQGGMPDYLVPSGPGGAVKWDTWRLSRFVPSGPGGGVKWDTRCLSHFVPFRPRGSGEIGHQAFVPFRPLPAPGER